MPLHQLPGEVWLHVLSYLSVADKHSVRATCKYFKQFVDCGLLWKDWTIILGFPKGSYSRQFWETLRRRKINHVVVRSTKEKDLKQLARGLPSITSLVMDINSQESLGYLKYFPQLTHLAVRYSSNSLLLDASTVCEPEKMTHLSICRVEFPSKSRQRLDFVFQDFVNLTSLVCHDTGISAPYILTVILCRLPRLKHLSLTCGSGVKGQRVPASFPGEATLGLSSLELIHCDHLLLRETMKLLPNLQTLVLVYMYSVYDVPSQLQLTASEDMKTWLSGLHHLSTLVIKLGPRVHSYVRFIPVSVSRLTLRVPGLNSGEFASVASQVPNLLHLHVDTWPTHLGTLAAEIPQLFPKLQSLKVRGEHVSEEDFLGFQKMADLRYVEMLDSSPQSSKVAAKLQMLTNYRLHVTMSHQRDILECHCSY
uniref:F-box domain-containing protein n=1 Tax=Hippocampus comes TaxID=109280 RepID=A0A3Q3DDL7_HIPCM